MKTRFQRLPGRVAAGATAAAFAAVPAVFVPQVYDDFTLAKQVVLVVCAAVAAVGLTGSGVPAAMPRWILAGMGAWLGMLLLATAFGLDPRGSILGYYQYRQGLLTQLAYVVLLAAGWWLAATGRWAVFRTAAAGLAAAFAYTAVQAAGADPLAWWIDTSDRAIGTIGNANELSALAVISMGVVAFAPPERRLWWAALTWPAVLFIVLEAESRSGLAAFVLFFVLLGPATLVAGHRLRVSRRVAATLSAGLAAAAVLSLAAGGLEGTAARVSGEPGRHETAGSTRLALWEGTLRVVADRPLLGAGADGLHLAFPRSRPAGLGGAYAEYDLVAQSSHNALLDTAANYGLPGLAALLALVGGCAAASVWGARHTRDPDAPPWPVVWAAMAAYGALTLVNPISLAAHALFFAMLGGAAACAERGRLAHSEGGAPTVRWRAMVLAAMPAGLACAVVLPLPFADLRAQQGWDAFAGSRFAEGAGHYRAAARLAPTERDYARRETVALVAAASVDRTYLPLAKERLLAFDREFGFSSADALNLAAVLIAEGRPESEIVPVLQRALSLNPNGVATAWYIEQLRQATERGGVLVHDPDDHWTYVVPLPELPDEAGGAGG